MRLLNTGGVLKRRHKREIHELGGFTAVAADERDGAATNLASHAQAFNDIRRIAARGDADHDVTRAGKCPHLLGKDVLKRIVVGDRGQRTAVRRERNGRQRRTLNTVAVDEFGRHMLRVRRTTAVAEDKERSALAKHLGQLATNPLGGVGNGLGGLADAAQVFPDLVGQTLFHDQAMLACGPAVGHDRISPVQYGFLVNREALLNTTQSKHAFEAARSLFVGGVNSPVRAFGGVGGSPIFAHEGRGAQVIDLDGNAYIDYVLSWGPLILGHAHPDVLAAASKALARGSSFGMPTVAETRLGTLLRQFFPEMERMRLVNSGTEATMSALRLARGATGRDAVIKFIGCYHGHVDSLLVQAGSGLATFGTPSSPGIPAGLARDTLALPFNDLAALRAAFDAYGERIAAVILETLPCNMGMVPPDPDFLALLQELATSWDTLIIADEVLTGLRAARGGAYHRFGLKPDLVAVGKVVGGGFPLAAYGGRQDLMAQLSPEGPVYQAGTLSGNPVAAGAGTATLEILQKMDPFGDLEARATTLADGLRSLAAEAGIPLATAAVGSILGMHFAERMPRTFDDVKAADHGRYARFFWGMLRRGVYLAPSSYEVGFLSTAHDDEVIDRTLSAARTLLQDGLDREEVPAHG